MVDKVVSQMEGGPVSSGLQQAEDVNLADIAVLSPFPDDPLESDLGPISCDEEGCTIPLHKVPRFEVDVLGRTWVPPPNFAVQRAIGTWIREEVWRCIFHV